MEMRRRIRLAKKTVQLCLCWFLFIAFFSQDAGAQGSVSSCTVRNGKMVITLSKQISEPGLDSFIHRYALDELDLKEFIRTNIADSLEKLGWKIEMNTRAGFVISKALLGFDDITDPADKILFTEKHPTIAERFPAVSSQIRYGYNRFRNKYPFAIDDSAVTFYLRNHLNADEVILSGSFTEWSPTALKMTKTDSGWIAIIKLGPGKYWYKFVIDGNWTTDRDNQLSENDGEGNTNSVYFKTNILFRLDGHERARRVYVSGNFNEWRRRELLMNKTAGGWELPVYLPEGTQTYRFIADGDWFADPGNPDRLPNEYGEYNSVIRLGEPHVFRLNGHTDAKQVILAGSFNGWRKNELFMTKTATGWEYSHTLGAGNYEYGYFINEKPVGKPATAGGESNLFLVIDPNYTFRLKGFERATTVFLAGDFNNWSPHSFLMRKDGDDWVLPVHLSPGKHLYKFIVDSNWILDPGNKLWEQNEYGTGNSILWFGQ